MKHITMTFEELLDRIAELQTNESLHFKRKCDLYGWGIMKTELFWDSYLILGDYTEGSTATIELSADYTADSFEDAIGSVLQRHGDLLDGFLLITEEEAGIIGFLCDPQPAPKSPCTSLENETYTFDVNGTEVSVTTEETLAFYGPYHALTLGNISNYAARYVAHMKHHREYSDWLNKALVKRLLDEERLMKKEESDGFKLQLTFDWYVEVKKEGDEFLPFKYNVEAWCLDNAQTFSRRYVTLSDAVLHCMNGFNENIAIKPPYCSIDQYLNDHHRLQ